ncbi:MAG TPA: protein kinase [Thermoanaerobaculia bacterium]|nr:protein kinase [Thermoanaerobaculia bacterium]
MLAAGTRIGPYEIVELLGEGGMGQVYRARDPRLGRDIAVKVLTAESRHNDEAVMRFEREARAVASLSHPNILSIHDFGSDEGIFFVVTELLQGRTLRDEMKTPISWRKAIEISAEIADGLSAAHSKAVVHRDLKPENIFLTADGHVKILDFGLAQTDPILSQQDETSIPTTKWFQTDPGAIIGTLGYMSPEQLRGEAVDVTADIFSLGCVMYEMVTAKRPFQRNSGAATIAAVLHDDVPHGDLSAAVPSEVQRVIEGCMEKRASARFQSARDLALTLRAIGSGALTISDVVTRGARAKKSKIIDSIAVLPLQNATGDADADYLSDGITEGIINRLSQIPKLKVMARSTVFRYRNRDADAQAIGRELRVRAVLTGRVQHVRDRLLINVELVDAVDGSHLWGESYNQELADLLELQARMSSEIAEKLRIRLTGAEKKKLSKKTTENSEAYQLYLKGRYHWNKRTEESLRKGISFFRDAIEVDPSFASAYTGLADSFITLATNVPLPPKEAMPKAKAAAMRAVEIDDQLAPAWASLAAIRWWYEWDWPGAEDAYKRAIELNPNYANAHEGYSMLLSARSRFDESIVQITKAGDLDPLSLIIAVHAGWPHYFARDYDAATRRFRKALELDEKFIPAHGWLGMSLGQQKRFGEAIDTFHRALDVERTPILLAMIGHAYAIAGERVKAIEALDALREEAKSRYVSPYDLAVIHAGLGNQSEAMRTLRVAFDDRSAWMVFIRVDPRLDPLRELPEFRELVARVG